MIAESQTKLSPLLALRPLLSSGISGSAAAASPSNFVSFHLQNHLRGVAVVALESADEPS
jgi:hypothetical protein